MKQNEKQNEIFLDNNTLLKWWFIYMILGGIAGAVAGVLLGFFGAFVGMSEIVLLLVSVPLFAFVNFLIYRWSIKKMLS